MTDEKRVPAGGGGAEGRRDEAGNEPAEGEELRAEQESAAAMNSDVPQPDDDSQTTPERQPSSK